jgi:type II secretory pathway pseudopilin PulG
MSAVRSRQTARLKSDGTHEGFLAHKNFRWLKIALVLAGLALLAYLMIDQQPRPNGGSALGYTLGTIGALLILWLTALGYRKRKMTRGAYSLKGWTSAHVYLGLSLVVVATLHTGFDFGWTVHTLAYVLMLLVIASGIFGISAYATLPQAMSNNRDQMTETQMLGAIRAIDRQLHEAAQPLDQAHAALVQSALEQDPFGGSLFARLAGRYAGCATLRAQTTLRLETGPQANIGNNPLEKIDSLLGRKLAILSRVRKHLRYKALLEIWLYVHIPLTFALIAALAAHIISVFFYW